nr:MAG TPA: hypothetical protein [Herelleviridae sp.]
MQNQNSKELTAAYKAQTLPDGWYYFSCAGTKPQIGKYVHPTVVAVTYAAQNGLDRPKPALYACPGLFVGALDTIKILAPVADYETLLKD